MSMMKRLAQSHFAYRCTKCKAVFVTQVERTNDEKKKCPVCKGKLRKAAKQDLGMAKVRQSELWPFGEMSD